ncbi:MAG TPA: hypothetical protein VNA24_20660 [Hyalangium sp.]|nr:hypothetical protein [Hyalangium sp.]
MSIVCAVVLLPEDVLAVVAELVLLRQLGPEELPTALPGTGG